MRPTPRSCSCFLNLMLLMLFALAMASAVTAQPPPVEVAIVSAKANLITVDGHVKGWAVFVSFTRQFARSDSSQAESPANYRIINANTGTKDAAGESTLLTLSKGPKDYLDSKFTVKINDFFGPYVGYEWGRLPPNYKLVDHKWTFGIIFKSQVRAK